jgi:hypothetical protein
LCRHQGSGARQDASPEDGHEMACAHTEVESQWLDKSFEENRSGYFERLGYINSAGKTLGIVAWLTKSINLRGCLSS